MKPILPLLFFGVVCWMGEGRFDEIESEIRRLLQCSSQFAACRAREETRGFGENYGSWELMRSDAVTAMFGQFAITRFSADTRAVVLLPSRVYKSCSIG